MANKVHRIVQSDGVTTYGYHFQCPGCEEIHTVRVGDKHGWTFNGDLERPTFHPSVLCWRNMFTGRTTPPEYIRCHSFVLDGMIRFLGDCTHKLAGQTVPLGDLPEWLEK